MSWLIEYGLQFADTRGSFQISTIGQIHDK
jgi:hypothetical protein